MQCPKCKRSLAAVPGASRVQCFGCGSVVDLAATTHRGSIAKPASNSTRFSADNTAKKAVLAVLVIGAGLVVLVGVGLGTFFFLLKDKAAQQDPAPTIAAGEQSANSSSETLAPTNPPEELVPAFTATAEERALAAKVAQSNRQQIIQMWDQLTATTRKKLLIPKNSYTRNSVENLLNGIEQREVRNMAALLQVDEAQVNAVIQVEMADRAEKALQELMTSG